MQLQLLTTSMPFSLRRAAVALLAAGVMVSVLAAALPAAAQTTPQTATYVLDGYPDGEGVWISDLSNNHNSPFPFNYKNQTEGGTYTSTEGTSFGFPIDLTIIGTGNDPAVYKKHKEDDRTITNVTGFLDMATIQITDINSLVIDSFTGSLNYSERFDIHDGSCNLSGDVFDSAGKEYKLSYAATSDQYSDDFNATATFAPVAPVPEASTTASLSLLLVLGMGGIVVAARKKKAAASV